MFICRQLWRASPLCKLSAVAGLTLVAMAIDTLADHAYADDAVGRLATYEKAPGESYFALSVLPKVAADAGQKNEVVILVDTSASQAGAVRDQSLAALNALLGGLGPNDRVKLLAVDVKAVPLTESFAAPGSPELQAGLAKLQQRVPLGATDLDAGLRAAAASFGDAGAAKTAVYLGDGLSKANLLTSENFGKLTADLVKDRVSVSSFAIGHDRNVQVLAALANHTGGVVALDAPMADAAAAGGAMLAQSVHAGVIWPTKTSLPASMAEAFPKVTPPLRTDRDSILIGKLAAAEGGDVTITGEMNGKPVELVAKVAPEKPSEDFAFLPKLVELAQTDEGLSLPTVGSGGLREAATVTMTSAEQLAKLGHEALASGNVAGAIKVADAALARDPKNPEALAVREAAKKLAAGGKVPAAAEPDLKLAHFDEPAAPAAPPAAGSLLEEVLAEKPGFIVDVEKQRAVLSGKIRAEVENGLNAARKMMGDSPELAEQDLKALMESVERSPDLDAEVRGQLREQIEVAIRQARQQALVVADRKARAQEAAATAIELQRVNDELTLREQRLKQVMDRFDSLMDEGRYQVADQDVIPEVQRLAPDTPIASAVMTSGRFKRAYEEMRDLWRRRQDGYLRTMYQVETSHVPFPDEPPVVYPDPQWWEQISIERKRKYASMDLLKTNSSESRIYEQLNKPTTMEFVETPLKDAIEFLASQHEIPIVLNAKKLEEAGVNIDTPVTKNLKGVTLRSALRLMLSELELTYMVKDEVLQITTPEDAESPDNMVTKVYNVGDLVVPIQNNSNFGIGGIGGGMGGMMGGMGGMGGGMMGGMGGMGGGMMGGMGGMGGGMGGMFAVEDDLSLGTKKTPAVAPAAVEPQVRRPASEPAATPKVKARRISVTVADGESPSAAWDRYFSDQKASLTAKESRADGDSSQAMRELLASVRETVRQLRDEKKYGEIPVLIQAALRNGIIESWMYEAMGLAMQADNASPEDLERALMSAVDLASSQDEVMFIASYMDSVGLHARALSLCRQLGEADRTNPRPFMQGLALAQRLGDIDAIQWAAAGILSQAWTNDDLKVPERAYRVAKATYEQLLADGKKKEAQTFEAAINKARRRDCLVVVTWTGDADVDLSVEEPAGTVCSTRQPRTTSGGVHLGDVASTNGKPASGSAAAKGLSEAYVCSEAFAGQYRVLLKNVWGRPTSGKVTIDIYTNYGTDQQRVIHEQIPLAEKNAVALFEVKDGRRKDALPEAQVANIAQAQNALNKQILAQQLAGLDNSEVARQFALALAMANQNTGLPFFRRGAVGYRPQIQTFPEGAGFQATAVISADRRYVRVSPQPFFSQINEVSTFNFVTGQGGTQQQGQGGGGGVGFGGAGGFGGGGGFF